MNIGKRFFKNTKKPKPMADETLNNNDNPTQDKFAVVVDQDGLFLRVERGGVEVEPDSEYEIFEEQVEKPEVEEKEEEQAHETVEAESDEYSEGDTVVFSEAVANLFGTTEGTFIESISSAEAKVLVGEVEQIVGFDCFEKVVK